MADHAVTARAAAPAPPAPHGRMRPGWSAFLRACALLGVTGFGGGLAILGQAGMLFERKRWLTEREWLHTATVAQLIPGGAATNALAYVGLRFFGPLGALAAVGVYVAPATALMIGLAFGYTHVHEVPYLQALLAGFNGALVGLVVAVTFRLGQAGLRRGWQAILAATALALERLGHATVLEVIVFGILTGLAADSLQKRLRLHGHRKARAERTDAEAALPEPSEGPPKKEEAPRGPEGGRAKEEAARDADAATQGRRHSFPMLLLALDSFRGAGTTWSSWISRSPPGPVRKGLDWLRNVGGTAAFTGPLTLGLLLTCARVGAVAYGGGFTIVPLLEREAVEQHHWVTHTEFADAIALGQVTPGPVLIAATFIGTRAGGVIGGLMATLGVFAVPALLTIGAGAWLDRWRRTRAVKAALRGLVPAVVGMMASAALGLSGGRMDEAGIILAAAAFVAAAQFKLNPAAVLLASGAVRVGLLVLGVANV